VFCAVVFTRGLESEQLYDGREGRFFELGKRGPDAVGGYPVHRSMHILRGILPFATLRAFKM
jgi:hypothetical protein